MAKIYFKDDLIFMVYTLQNSAKEMAFLLKKESKRELLKFINADKVGRQQTDYV